ncbi:FG-GAP-like repeat-containing protein [Flavobacteriaceae bacterium]|nr:FG-GAP-like repeat-containing protein [Flavobacteriaceae bacterium]MDA9584499.1 FG-GAP-like repeat-containing protein [Flavobacteriaceae bacterium]MDB2633574.1 FG-GAP-like repeat-containing protein [Flavobacteriaceae bacterium]MDC0331775.1 FG-GAP-like repeat-containing protein [Flavobacteriaceae bacterium]
MTSRFFILFLIFSNLSNAQLAFEDVATQVGVNYSYGDSEYGGGVSFADFNNDGWDDITYATEDGAQIYFFENNNGVFNLVTLNGISNTHKTKQVIWIDYDNDGDKDLFVTAIEGVNEFYRNEGGMNFTNISSSIGFFQTDLFTYGTSFGDIDNDGDLDAFISNRTSTEQNQRNYLYRNDEGTFVDITQSSGIPIEDEEGNENSQLSFCTMFFDYNKDGFQDIYLANDKTDNINRLYKNLGNGTFEDVSVASGSGIAVNAMTTTLGDYNNDGWFDIYITNTQSSQAGNGNVLLKNNGDGTFTNVAEETGTTFNSLAWGAVFLDADNDTLLDLYVSGGFDGSIGSFLSAAFYHQQNDGTFVIPQNIGFENDTRKSFSNAIGDINNDGKPDIIVCNDTENNFLWENKTTNTNNWLKVKLEGVTTNRDGIGNTIEIFINGRSQYRYTLAGEGYISQNSYHEFFGLGEATEVDYVKVTWTGTNTEDIIYEVNANQSITIKEGIGVLTSNDIQTNTLFSLYPNPSNDGVFKLSVNNNKSNTLKLYDLAGRLIFKIKNLKDKDQFSLNHCKKGIYLAKVSSDHKSSTIKLVLN